MNSKLNKKKVAFVGVLFFLFIMLTNFFEIVFLNIKIQQKYTIPATKISKIKLIHVDTPIVSLWHQTSITVIKAAAKNIERASLWYIFTFIVFLETIIILTETVSSAITDAIAAPFCVYIGIKT